MAEMNFTVDGELKARFEEAAQTCDRTAAQLLRDFMRDYVRQRQDEAEYDAWFRAEVEQGLREADDPTVPRIPHEEVLSSWQQQRAELLERAKRAGKNR